MVKTRSKTGNVTLKKEEEDCKPTLLLNGATNTRNNKITKRKPTTHRNNLSAQQIKVEEDTDTKSLLQASSNSSKLPKPQKILQEQINQLIHYIVNDNMSIRKASRKVNISGRSGSIYYKLYKDDPEKRIPLPRDQTQKMYTQEQIGNLIRYINNDKMTVTEASVKANMTYISAHYYYSKYLKDPNHNIPLTRVHQHYMQDQKNELIGYIINGKMSISAASKKAKMNPGAAQRYYCKYFKVQNPDIPTPSHVLTKSKYTQEHIKEVISYIVDDKMPIAAASKKAHIGQNTTRRHYQQYLKGNNIEHPVPKRTKVLTRNEINQFIGYVADDKMTIREASKKVNMCTDTGFKHYYIYLKDHNLDPRPPKCAQDQINELIRCIVDDKLTLAEASKKANMCVHTGRKYYRQYLKDRHIDYSIRKLITQEQKSELIRYIVDDKMSITAASKKANMGFTTGYKYYRQYLKDQKRNAPILKRATQDQVNELIGYVVDDKMSLKAALKKANMTYTTGYRHYRRYLNDHKHDAPTRRPRVVSARKNE